MVTFQHQLDQTPGTPLSVMASKQNLLWNAKLIEGRSRSNERQLFPLFEEQEVILLDAKLLVDITLRNTKEQTTHHFVV
jgi:hypothetical protein